MGVDYSDSFQPLSQAELFADDSTQLHNTGLLLLCIHTAPATRTQHVKDPCVIVSAHNKFTNFVPAQTDSIDSKIKLMDIDAGNNCM